MLGAWILGSLESGLLGVGHIARIGSHGVGRKLGMLRHERFYSFALLGRHTQRGIARKKHGAVALVIIAIGPNRVLHTIVEDAHKRHGIDFVAEPHLLEIVITRLIQAQCTGELLVDGLVASVYNDLGKEDTVGAFKLRQRVVGLEGATAGVGRRCGINVMAGTTFLLIGDVISKQVFLLQVAAFAARHGEHNAETGVIRATDIHAGGGAVDGNLNHGVVYIIVAIAHLVLEGVRTLGVEHHLD